MYVPIIFQHLIFIFFFFFNNTATTEIYTLSLHDALPICDRGKGCVAKAYFPGGSFGLSSGASVICKEYHASTDRKSTRLNSSHTVISYAVFCLKKKKK